MYTEFYNREASYISDIAKNTGIDIDENETVHNHLFEIIIG